MAEQGRELFGQAAVLARQSDPLRHAFVEFCQALWVQLGVAHIAAQTVSAVLDLCNGAVQGIDRVFEVTLQMQLALQLLQGRMQCVQRVVLAILQQFDGDLRGVLQCLTVGQTAMVGVEFGPFVGLWLELLQVTDLPGQPFAFALQGILGLHGGVERGLGLAPLGPEC